MGGAGLVGLVWAWPSRGVARKDREAVGVVWGLARAWPHVGGAGRGGAWRGRGLHKRGLELGFRPAQGL